MDSKSSSQSKIPAAVNKIEHLSGTKVPKTDTTTQEKITKLSTHVQKLKINSCKSKVEDKKIVQNVAHTAGTNGEKIISKGSAAGTTSQKIKLQDKTVLPKAKATLSKDFSGLRIKKKESKKVSSLSNQPVKKSAFNLKAVNKEAPAVQPILPAVQPILPKTTKLEKASETTSQGKSGCTTKNAGIKPKNTTVLPKAKSTLFDDFKSKKSEKPQPESKKICSTINNKLLKKSAFNFKSHTDKPETSAESPVTPTSKELNTEIEVTYTPKKTVEHGGIPFIVKKTKRSTGTFNT